MFGNIKETTNYPIKLKDKVILGLFSLYFIIFPFYFWSSGLPQLADFLMLAILLLLLVFGKLNYKIKNKLFIKYNVFFIYWIVIVNLIWTLKLSGNAILLKPIVYYLYNFLVIYTVSHLYANYKDIILNIAWKSIIFSMLIQIIFIFFEGGFTGIRVTGSFNNPNQLGIYAILSLGLVLSISLRTNVSFFWKVITIFQSMFLILVSLSNAAIISYFFMLLIFLVSNLSKFKSPRIRTKKKWFQITIIIMVMLTLIIILYIEKENITNSSLSQSVGSRLLQTESKVKGASYVRGYNRIIDYPRYWIFGAGEGAHWRFIGHGGEIHSTFGAVQLYYGLIGTVMFLRILYSSISSNYRHTWYILLSIMIYGLSHNGLRNSLFWLILTLFTVIPYNKGA